MKRNNICCLVWSILSLGIQFVVTPEFGQVLTNHLLETCWSCCRNIKQFCSISRAVLHLRRSSSYVGAFIFIVYYGNEVSATSNQPIYSRKPKNLVFYPQKCVSICRKHAKKEASNGNVKGVPAVVLAAAILGHRHSPVSSISVWLLPCGSGARLRVVLVVLIEVAVLHHA